MRTARPAPQQPSGMPFTKYTPFLDTVVSLTAADHERSGTQQGRGHGGPLPGASLHVSPRGGHMRPSGNIVRTASVMVLRAVAASLGCIEPMAIT